MTIQGKIIDTTLREGEQTPGVRFSLEQKKRIIDSLAAIGVAEVEVGISSRRLDAPQQLINYCRQIHPGLRLSLWSRCRSGDISHAAALSPDILSLSVPVSDIHLEKKFNRNRTWARKSMLNGILLAKKQGLAVSMGFEDATRGDKAFICDMAVLATRAGAERIRIADTVGIASPLGITDLLSAIRRKVGSIQLALHAHNDFGMATANAITALEAGAEWVDGVILGLGERAGCARLEELVGYLSIIKGVQVLKSDQIKTLASYVAGIVNKKIDGQHPLLGNDIFTCETGLHLQGLLLEPETYEPYCPERIGAQRKLLFGVKSGRKALKQRLDHITGHEQGRAYR